MINWFYLFFKIYLFISFFGLLICLRRVLSVVISTTHFTPPKNSLTRIFRWWRKKMNIFQSTNYKKKQTKKHVHLYGKTKIYGTLIFIIYYKIYNLFQAPDHLISTVRYQFSAVQRFKFRLHIDHYLTFGSFKNNNPGPTPSNKATYERQLKKTHEEWLSLKFLACKYCLYTIYTGNNRKTHTHYFFQF